MRKFIAIAAICAATAAIPASAHTYHFPTKIPTSFRSDGTVQHRTFYSAALKMDREYFVYLPPGYSNPGNERRYPVLYMLHGCPGHPADWIEQGNCIPPYEDLLRQHRVQPMIMVFPDGEGPRKEFDCTGFLNRADGGWNMEDALVNDQVSEADEQFRTLPDPGHRAILGLSAGGYAAVNLAVRHPDVFGTMASHSGYFNVADYEPIAQHMLGADAGLRAGDSPVLTVASKGMPSGQHVYIDVGDDDKLLANNKKFAALLQRTGADYVFRVWHGKHTFAGWHDQLPYSLTFVDRCFRLVAAPVRTAVRLDTRASVTP